MGATKLLPKAKFTTADTFIVFIIACVSLATRFWVLYNPDCVVFDEVHFGNFTNWYIKQEYFYDIHPPLGKLVMAFIAYLQEYDGEIDFEKHYGNKYDRPDFITIRITPALFSSFCAPLIYMTVRFAHFSKLAAFVSAFFIIFDTSLLTEQRFILSDGMLHFFTCLFLVAAQWSSQLKPYSEKWNNALIQASMALGCACACKNTAWGLCVYIAFLEINDVLRYTSKMNDDMVVDIGYRGSHFISGFILVQFLSFAVHFLVLPYSGQGTAYMPDPMQKQLIKKEIVQAQVWAKQLKWPDLFTRIITLIVNMHFGNMGITQFHPYQSRPQGWPLLTDTWVAFWGNSNTEVNCIGNVFIYYIGLFSLFGVLACFKVYNFRTALNFVIGYCASYFPFFLIPRSMYLYHYLIPLMFLCILTGCFLDLAFPPKIKGFVAAIFCGFALFGFYLWSPYAYGTPHLDQELIVWTDNWIYGDKFHRKLAEQNR